MNLLKGFLTQADQQPVSSAIELELPQADLSGEPSLMDMLSDPVMLSMMERDDVSRADIIRLFRHRERVAA